MRRTDPEIKVYACNAGYLKTQTQFILKDTRIGTPMDIPIPFLVIRHGPDWIAFDTGCNGATSADPVAYWGEELAKGFWPVIGPDEEFAQAIRPLGLKPADFKAVILSHGHLDHAGAIQDFRATGVPIYVQKVELAQIREVLAKGPMGTAYIPRDYQYVEELNFREVEGVFDVFGDRSVVAFPTPGHTLGHQSLYVKPSAGKAFIYAADALYTLECMERAIPPAVAADAAATMQNIHWLKLEKLAGIPVVPSHDSAYWAKRAWSPAEFVP